MYPRKEVTNKHRQAARPQTHGHGACSDTRSHLQKTVNASKPCVPGLQPQTRSIIVPSIQAALGLCSMRMICWCRTHLHKLLREAVLRLVKYHLHVGVLIGLLTHICAPPCCTTLLAACNCAAPNQAMPDMLVIVMDKNLSAFDVRYVGLR